MGTCFIERRALLLSALASVPAAGLLRAQKDQSEQTKPAPSPGPTFSTDVKVVNVFATVRDKDGHIVTNLTKEDFTLLEDGRPQTIRYFAQQSDLPLTLGLLVDTSMSERRMIPTERQASYSFLEQVLRPEKDKAFLIDFTHDVELLQDLRLRVSASKRPWISSKHPGLAVLITAPMAAALVLGMAAADGPAEEAVGEEGDIATEAAAPRFSTRST